MTPATCTIIPNEVLASISTIVNATLPEEEAHFETSEGAKNGHIYHDLAKVKAWLDSIEREVHHARA